MKGVMDALGFAKNEGLDYTMGGRVDDAIFNEMQVVAEAMVRDLDFGQPYLHTIWVSAFLPMMLRIATMPLVEPTNKLHFFLNHRELLYSTLKILGIPVKFPSAPLEKLPSASAMIIEVYDEGVKLFLWEPTHASYEVKAEYEKNGWPVAELFAHGGTLIPTAVPECKPDEICPTTALIKQFTEFVSKTGTWNKICNVSKEISDFATGEIDTGISDHLDSSLWRDDPKPEELSSYSDQQTPAAAFSVSLAMVTQTALLATTFVLGWWGGRRHGRSTSIEGSLSHYVRVT